MTKIVILGKGTVGQSTEMFLKHHNQDLDILFNDPYKDLVLEDEQWNGVDYVIVCVNSNLNTSLSLPENDTANLDDAVNYAFSKGYTGPVIIRSTIGVESAIMLLTQLADDLIMWPEYIREATWQADSIAPPMVILGGNRAEEFSSLFESTYTGKLVITDPVEAMVAKLSTNAFLSTKVIFANQVRMLCEKYNISYSVVSQLLANEGRLGSSHWQSPGPDGQAGFGGKCFPKDMQTFETALVKAGVHVNLVRAVLDLNSEMRPDGT